MNFKFKSLLAFNDCFTNEAICYEYLESKIWKDGKPFCPHCESREFYKVKSRVANKDIPSYRCANRLCGLPFSSRTGTIFEGSKIELRKWFTAIYLFVSSKKGLSSVQLSETIDISQKSAWLMLHKIRNVSYDDNNEMLDDEVQLDETFVGGKNKNRHADKKVKNSAGRSFKDKTPVFGILTPNKYKYELVDKETGECKRVVDVPSKIRCFVVPDTKASTLQPIIIRNVKEGSKIISDEWLGYSGLGSRYNHCVVDHGAKQYVNIDGDTSNGVENAWSHLKRSIIGIYYSVTRKHLKRYVNEFVHRFNNRTIEASERFETLFQKVSRYGIRYNALTRYKMTISVHFPSSLAVCV